MTHLESQTSSKMDLDEEERLLHQIKSSREAYRTYLHANKILQHIGEPPIKLQIKDSTSSGFRGECLINEITILKGQSKKEKRAVLLFEILNAAHSPEFKQASQQLNRGEFKNSEHYVKHMEQIEYKSLLCYLEIMTASRWSDSSWGWVKRAREVNRGFEHYYKHILGEEHKNHWRKHWEATKGTTEKVIKVTKKERKKTSKAMKLSSKNSLLFCHAHHNIYQILMP